MHRADVKALRKVWVTYGQAHLPLIEKYVKRSGLEVILQFIDGAPSFMLPFPFKGFVYIGNFHLMHLFGILTVASWIAAAFMQTQNMIYFSAVLTLLTLYFAYEFIKWNLDMEPKNQLWTWCKLKYLTNLSFIQGGLKDFKKHKILCIEPSF
jgi:hypothetical protein